jgi:hypothetical protein
LISDLFPFASLILIIIHFQPPPSDIKVTKINSKNVRPTIAKTVEYSPETSPSKQENRRRQASSALVSWNRFSAQCPPLGMRWLAGKHQRKRQFSYNNRY